MQQQKEYNKLKAKQLQKKLEALQTEYNKALQLLQVVRILQQQTPNNKQQTTNNQQQTINNKL